MHASGGIVYTYATMNREIPTLLRISGEAHELYAATRIEELEAALRQAREIIRIWHGDICWVEYQFSPEMKQINRAIEGQDA